MKLTAQLKRMNQYRNEPLVAASRYNDERAQALGRDVGKIVREAGLDVTLMHYIVEQRMARVALFSPDLAMVPATAYDAIARVLYGAYLDAILLGWRAREYATTGVPVQAQIAEPVTQADFDAWMGDRR